MKNWQTTFFSLISFTIFLILLLPLSLPAAGFTSVTSLQQVSITANTGEKPQSKCWTNGGYWFSVLSSSGGTDLYRLDGTTWTNILHLSDATDAHADARAIGNVTHILLFRGTSSQLVSVEYLSGTHTYQLWTTRPTLVNITLDSGVETATIDVDSYGRMWLASDNVSDINVRWSDSPYSTWSSPITIGTGISSDDISVVTALPALGKVGVLWSNQSTKRFGFKTHTDGADPSTWSADEVPASQSAQNVGAGMADDHLNVAVATDGTLYAAVKTSYDTPGYPKIALLIRRTSGTWDNLYEVDQTGTRGIVLLNETKGEVTVCYTQSEGANDIVYKASALSPIAFGTRQTLMSGSLNEPSSTKQNFTNEVVILASSSSNAVSVLASTGDASLIAYYMMDEGSGTWLRDTSLYGNHGRTVNSPTWVAGFRGQAQSFNGSSQYDTVVSASSLNITGSITIAAWIAPGKTGTQHMIKKALMSNIDGYELSLSNPGRVFFRLNQKTSGDVYRINSLASYPITGTWIHAAATYDGSTLKMYINGALDSSKTIGSISIATNTLPLTIARDASAGNYYQGKMDEVHIYNRALSLSEIQTLVSQIHTITATAGTGGVISPTGTAIVPHNGSQGFTITADPGYTISNVTVDGVSQGAISTYTFSNVIIDHTINATFLSGGVSHTITASAGTNGSISPSGAVSVADAGSQLFTITPDPGYHVADVLVDLVSVGAVTSYTFNDVTTDHTISASFAINTYQLTVSATTGGNITAPGSPTVTVNHGVATTITAEAQTGYQFTGWTVVSGTGVSIATPSALSTTVTLTSGDAAVQANFGLNEDNGADYALDFDGTDDYVNCGNNASVQITGTAITMEAWIKPVKVATMAILKKCGVIGGNTGYELYPGSGGKLFIRINGIDVSRATSLTSYPTDGTWMHVAATYDGANTKIYINGVLEATTPYTTPIATTTNPLYIANDPSTTARFFQGAIDEVRLWNIARSDADIKANMTKKLIGNESGLVGYWRFDEASGTSMNDETSNNNDGSMINMDPATDRVWSGAALGDASAYDYDATGGYTATLNHTNGDALTATTTSGTPTGIQVYRSDDNALRTGSTGLTGYSLDPSRFWGVKAYGTTPIYTLVYNYTGNPAVTSETGLKLVKRNDISVSAWADANATLDIGANTLTVAGATGTEYALAIPTGPTSYQLTVTSTTGGTITAPPSSPVTVNQGAATTITAVATAGYTFTGWTVVSGTGVTIATPSALSTTVTLASGDAAVRANFTLNTYQLTVTTTTGGTITAPPSSPVTVNHGAATTITVVATAGYTFTGWTVVSGSGVSIATPSALSTTATLTSGDATVQANFTPSTYQLTVTSTTGGTITAPPSSPVTVGHGVATTITVVATAGYTFTGWTVVSGSGVSIATPSALSTTATLTSGNATVQANFIGANLVAYYMMDEGSGTTLRDSSGTGNNGTITGGPTWSAGMKGLALGFNGTSQYASVLSAPNLDITGPITLSAWFRCEATVNTSAMKMITKATQGSTDGYELFLANTGRIAFRLNQKTSGNTYYVYSATSYPLNGTAWMHAAATYDGSTMKLYITGIQEGGNVAGPVSIGTNTGPLSIAQDGGAIQRYNGKLDEVRVYNRALSQAEIQALMNHTITASAGTGGSISPTGAVSVAHNGSQTFSITADPVYSILAVTVDGVSQGALTTYTFSSVIIDHTINAVFVPTGGHTITASAGANGSISPSGLVSVPYAGSQTFNINPNTGYHVLDVLVDGGSVGAVTSYPFTNVTTDHTISASFAINTYTLTVNATNGTVAKVPDQLTYDHGTSVQLTATPNTGYVFLNWSVDLTGSANPATIIMDGNKTVTANFASSLVAHWSMNEGSGAVLVDSSTNGNNGAISGSPTWTTGVHGQSLVFNGSTTYAVVPSSSSLNITGPCTFAAWIRPNAHGTMRLIYKLTGSAGYEFFLGSVIPYPVSVRINNSARLDSKTTYPIDGSWMHVAATVDGATFKMYINGVLDTSTSSIVLPATGTSSVGIGATSVGAYPYNGRLDDVRIYNRALTLSEIQVLASHIITATAGTGGVISPAGTVNVAHYADQTFTFTPNPGYVISVVTVDGVSQGNIPNYTFIRDTIDHTINATFIPNGITHTITATAGTNGSISPSGAVSVADAGSQIFTITPALNYIVDTLFVDGSKVDSTTSYTFLNVFGDHTISAKFKSMVNLPPNAPSLVSPTDGSSGVSRSPSLNVSVSDPNGDPMTATFYGKPTTGSTGENFTIIELPDAQGYPVSSSGIEIFKAQTRWIVNQRATRNIVFVNQIGDIVENGDANQIEWMRVDTAMRILEDPVTTGLPEGIPYGISIGNHDETPKDDPNGTTIYYNQYFGSAHFAGKSYYGGHYGSNNDNCFQLFTASGMNFIVVNFEYNSSPAPALLHWADSLLKAHSTRRAIVCDHYLMDAGNPGSFSSAGRLIYDSLKDNSNLFLMLGGHTGPEGRRSDTYNGNTVYSVLADYQGEPNGGNGWLRIMEFSPSTGEISVKTYSPTLDQYKTGSSSQFTLSYTMDVSNFQVIGTNLNVPSGSGTNIGWPGLAPLTQYDWYVTLDDGHNVTTGPTWAFTTRDTEYTITASAGANGTISPNGSVIVSPGADQHFSIIPNSGYRVDSLLVDGILSDSSTSYTFRNVLSAHTIRAVYKMDLLTIIASAGANGTISPVGTVDVNRGADQQFVITANTDYRVDSVLVDGILTDSSTSYTFKNVTSAHTIRAVFRVNSSTMSTTANAGWNLLSIPVQQTDMTPAGVFGDDYGATSYYVYQFVPASGYVVPTTLTMGQGYWLGSNSTQIVDAIGTPLSSVSIPLTYGFNIIGSPFITDEPKTNLQFTYNAQTKLWGDAVTAGWLSNVLWSYTGSGYASAGTVLNVWKGYWIPMLVNGATVQYTAAGGHSMPKVSEPIAEQMTATNWNVDLAATLVTANGKKCTDEIASFGVRSDATAGFDSRYDAPRPPKSPNENYIEISFPVNGESYPKLFGTSYARDYKSAEKPAWEFTVNTSGEGTVTLTWEKSAISALGSDVKIQLYDETAHKLVDMKKVNTYTFEQTGTSRRFTVNKAEEKVPNSFRLTQNYPNPFNPTTVISYELPADAVVDIEVSNILGERVATLASGELVPAGYHELKFDATKLASGLYIYRISAITNNGVHFTDSKKMVLVK